MKQMIINFRNALAFIYAWLVLCTVLTSSVFGVKELSVSFLLKLFALCAVGVFCFVGCFLNPKMQKKGFIFSLTIFFVLIVPIEILMFYLMGIFVGGGSILMWVLFAAAVVISYIASIVIDNLIMKKRGNVYTEKLNEYKNSNGNV